MGAVAVDIRRGSDVLPRSRFENRTELFRLRAYPNNRVVMRPSEKFEARAAGKKCSQVRFLHVENVFGRQRRYRASLGDRAGYLDRL